MCAADVRNSNPGGVARANIDAIDAESLVASSSHAAETASDHRLPPPPPPTNAAARLLRDEVRSQLQIAGPTIAGMLLYKLPWLWSLRFVAKLGPDALAAAALATTLCNVTGMSFAVGLSFGLSTLTGQAKGDLLRVGEEAAASSRRARRRGRTAAEEDPRDDEGEGDDGGADEGGGKKESDPLLTNHSPRSSYSDDIHDATTIALDTDEDLRDMPIQPLVFLFRGLFVQLLFVVPIGLWWIRGIEPLLLALGQGAVLSEMTQAYLRILTPGLWSYSVNFTFTFWLQSIDMADVPAYAAFAAFAMHIPFNLLFVNVLGYGYEGVAMATVMNQLLQPMLISGYLFGTSLGRRRMLERTGAEGIGRTHLSMRKEIRTALSSLMGIFQYLKLGLPGIVVITEWWASEACIFLAGRLAPEPAYALGAMSIYQSLNGFCFMFPIGFSSAASARVGMFLGKADPRRAKLASFVSLVGAGALSAVMSGILLGAPHDFFPRLFTSDARVVSATAATMPFLAVYVFADGLQTTLNGILKGCGRQAIAMPIVIVSYWCVGVPMAYYNSFVSNDGTSDCRERHFCGTAGLVAGMTVGTWTHFVLLLLAVLVTIDFRKEAIKAQERVSLEDEKKNAKGYPKR